MTGHDSLAPESGGGTTALGDRIPLSGPSRLCSVSARHASAALSGHIALLAALAALPLGVIACSHGPQPVVRKSAAAPPGPLSAPADAAAPASAASTAASTPTPAGVAAAAATPTPASGASAPLATAGNAAGVPTAAAPSAAAVALPAAGSPAPPLSPALASSENARKVSAAKQAGAEAGGAGKPVSPNAGIGGAPPTGAQGKVTVPGKLEHPENIVVIDDGETTTDKPKTLVEAAKAEKARRAQSGPSTIVITDKTLHKYAKGTLTVAAPKKPAAAATATAAPEHDETFWRRGAVEIRLRMKKAAEQVKELEQSASDWRRRFYAQDDPYVRDGQIKPAWDRVLDELRQAQTETDVSRRELEDFLDKGRHEGALPGWLREGIELEPPAPPKPAGTKNLEAIEPPVLKEPPLVNDPPRSN